MMTITAVPVTLGSIINEDGREDQGTSCLVTTIAKQVWQRRCQTTIELVLASMTD